MRPGLPQPERHRLPHVRVARFRRRAADAGLGAGLIPTDLPCADAIDAATLGSPEDRAKDPAMKTRMPIALAGILTGCVAIFALGFVGAAPASADVCVGPTSLIVECADVEPGPGGSISLTGGPQVGDCIVVVGDPCIPVYVG